MAIIKVLLISLKSARIKFLAVWRKYLRKSPKFMIKRLGKLAADVVDFPARFNFVFNVFVFRRQGKHINCVIPHPSHRFQTFLCPLPLSPQPSSTGGGLLPFFTIFRVFEQSKRAIKRSVKQLFFFNKQNSFHANTPGT